MPVGERRPLVGALVLVLAIGATLLGYFKPDPFADRAEVRAVIDDAGQLAPVGSEVRVAGVPVGEVSDRRRVGDDAEVTLELDDSVAPLREDATLRLRPRLAFEGTAYLELDPGSPGAPPLGDAAIPRSQTSAFVPLERVLRLADAPTRGRVRGTARGLAGALERGARASVRSTLRAAPPLLADTRTAARAARGPRGNELTGAVRGLSRTVDAFARQEGDLAPLLRASDRTLSALRGGAGGTDRAALRAAVAALPPALDELDRGGRALALTVRDLRPLARELLPVGRELGPAIAAARPLLREAAPALVRARPVLTDLRAGLAAGGSAAADARGLVRELRPSLEVLDGSLVPALLKETSLGLPAYLAFLNMFQGGGGASRAFTTSATPGAGHFMRFGFRFLTGMGVPAPPCALLERADAQLAQTLSNAGLCTP